VARSNLDWLGEILGAAEACARAPDPERAVDELASSLGESIAAEDSALTAQARSLMQRLLERAAAERTAPRSSSAPRNAASHVVGRACAAAAGLFAACTCAACVMQQEPPPAAPRGVPPHTAPAPGDRQTEPPDRAAGPADRASGPDETEERKFAEPPPDRTPRGPALPEDKSIQFRLEAVDVQSPSCGGCSYAMGVNILSYRVFVIAPTGLEFERFDLAGGKLSSVTISPDGRRVWGTLHAGGTPGNYQIAAVFRDSTQGKSAKRTQSFRVASAADLRCEPGPCSDPPGPMPGDRLLPQPPAGPPKVKRIHRKGPVVFTESNGQTGRDENGVPVVDFGVGLVAGKRKPAKAGSPKTVPEVTCSAGHVVAVKRAEVAGLKDWFRVTYSPGAANGGRMSAGTHTCTVRYRITERTTETHEAELRIRVTEDGTPSVAR
jgi:hypothetical protein